MVGDGGSSAGSYMADPTSPDPFPAGYEWYWQKSAEFPWEI